jgi:hypothetical protein
MPSIFTARIDSKDINVEKFSREGLYFASAVGVVGSRLSLVFCANVEGIAVELPVSGEVKTSENGQLFAVEFTEPQKLALRMLFDVKQSKPLDVLTALFSTSATSAKQALLRRTPRVATMMALCLVFMIVISGLVGRKGSVIIAPAAFISTTGSNLESNVAGKLEYLANSDEIQAGEIFAAIRTISGRAVYLEAGKSGRLISSGIAVGEQIEKGEKIFQMANADDKYFVDAFVNYSDVVTLATGYRVNVGFGDGAIAQLWLPKSMQISDVVPYEKFQDDRGNALVKVHLRLDDKDLQSRVGKAVTVKFVRESSLFSKFSSQFSAVAIGSMNVILGLAK